MIINIIVAVILLAIVANLAAGFFYLVRDKGRSQRSLKALTWRIALSLGLFILLMAGYALGIVKPHGVIPGQAPPATVTSEN